MVAHPQVVEEGPHRRGRVVAPQGHGVVRRWCPSQRGERSLEPGPRRLDQRPDVDRQAAGHDVEVTTAAVAELGLAPGREVWATVKAVDLAVYER